MSLEIRVLLTFITALIGGHFISPIIADIVTDIEEKLYEFFNIED